MGTSLATSLKEMFKVFLIEAGADVNAFGGRHSTALKASVENPYISMKKWKISNGAKQPEVLERNRKAAKSRAPSQRIVCGASVITAK